MTIDEVGAGDLVSAYRVFLDLAPVFSEAEVPDQQA